MDIGLFLDKNSDVLIGMGGALIGGLFALVGSYYTNLLSVREAKRNEQYELVAFLQSINDEMSALWSQYMSTIGRHLIDTPNGNAFLYIWPITQNYFIVYDENSIMFGKVRNEILRKQIITTYIMAKGIVDSYIHNNMLLKEFYEASYLYQETRSNIHLQKREHVGSMLKQYATTIKETHNKLESNIGILTSLLENEIISLQKN